jgi:hypothetical protein
VDKTIQTMRPAPIGEEAGVSPDYGERHNELSGDVSWAQIDLEIVVCVNGR